jgi:hypothetical protein
MLEDVEWEAGDLGEDPADGRPAGLRNREVENALLGEDDRPLLDVVGKAPLRLGDERRGVRRLRSFSHAHLRGFRRRSLRKPTRQTPGNAPPRARSSFSR